MFSLIPHRIEAASRALLPDINGENAVVDPTEEHQGDRLPRPEDERTAHVRQADQNVRLGSTLLQGHSW